MFAAATIFMLFTLSANYAIMLYSGAPYHLIPVLDWNSRKTLDYFLCARDNFKTFSAFGVVV
jgi:hypothetical protein